MNDLTTTRRVTVYNTLGQNERSVNSDALTWGELQSHLLQAGVSFSGMKAVVGDTQVTLESRDAQIPQTEFTLFLLPGKVRSGN
jgi:hypothetical protein